MVSFIIAGLACLIALFGLILVTPSVIYSWRIAPIYYNLARLGLPVITLIYFGPSLLSRDWPRRGSGDLLFLGGLALIVLAIVVYLYREPGDSHRKSKPQTMAASSPLSPDGLLLRTALPEDLPGAGIIFAEAFNQSFDLDFGPDRVRNGKLLAGLLAVKQPEVEVAILPETGQVVGAMWLDLGDAAVPSMTFGRSWPVLRQYLNWLHALYFSLYAMPSIMSKRGTPQQGYIQWLGVDPQWQGRRVGHFLVERAIERGCAAGKQELLLHTERSNQRARKLYTRLGFEERSFLSFGPRVRYVKPL